MEAWWQEITLLNKVFALSALLFSVLFVWQIIAILIGVAPDSHVQVDAAGAAHGSDVHGHAPHSADGAVTFTLVSLRSLLAFGTLFSWSGTLYLFGGTSAVLAIVFSVFWGLIAMFAVSYLLYCLLRLQERGNISHSSAIGAEGTVYMDIPEAGIGQIRVPAGGVMSFLKARSLNGMPLSAGTKVIVVGIDENNVLEVRPLEEEA